MSTADGSLFTISTSYCITTVSNGAYYNVDRGVDPLIYLSKFESYFDRKSLTAFINEMK